MYGEFWNPKPQAVWESRDCSQPVRLETVGSGNLYREKDEENSGQRRKHGPMNVRAPNKRGLRKFSGCTRLLLRQVPTKSHPLLSMSRRYVVPGEVRVAAESWCGITLFRQVYKHTLIFMFLMSTVESCMGFVGLGKSVVLPFCAQNDRQKQASLQRHNNG